MWLPWWPTERWRRRFEASAPQALAGSLALAGPLALTGRGQGGVRLMAVDPAAAALGLAPGMGLADARALVPDLIAAEAEPERDAEALAALADWCGRYAPWCATDGADGIRLDITGAAHLFGGEAAMLADALRRLAGFGLTAAAAIASTPAAAWAWARYRPSGMDAIIPPGIHSGAAALYDLPVAALRLEARSIETLNGLGLATIGSVAALPRAPLAARLGGAVLARLDQMLGNLAEPISPHAPAEPFLARLIFAEPISRREDLDAATLRLIERLCRDLTRKGRGARRLALVFYRVDSTVQRVEIGTSRPTHAAPHLARLFAERLETIDPGFGIEAAALIATETEPLIPAQSALPAQSADSLDETDLAALIDRLQNRLGAARVLRLIPAESHVPERAEMRALCMRWIPPVKGTLPVKAARPIKLLAPPEPIDATAPIPDDPPLSFRWRRAVHRVAAADGPERIGPEWWTGAPGRPRDYYRVENSEGRRFWLYREGLYGGDEPPRWFLHGFFA